MEGFGSADRHQARGPRSPTAQLVGEIKQLYSAVSDQRPAHVRADLCPEFIICVLEGILTRGERTLCERGHAAVVGESRAAISAMLESPLVAVAERATGRRVRARLSQTAPGSDIAVELFLLEAPAGAAGEPAQPL